MDLHRELEIMGRLRHLERKVDFLLRELNLEDKEKVTPAMLDLGDIKDLIREGHKLDAVRRYRNKTGSSLGDATNAVEAIERELQTG